LEDVVIVDLYRWQAVTSRVAIWRQTVELPRTEHMESGLDKYVDGICVWVTFKSELMRISTAENQQIETDASHVNCRMTHTETFLRRGAANEMEYVDVWNKRWTDIHVLYSYSTQPGRPKICGIKVLIAVTTKNTSLWDVTPCRLVYRKPVFRVKLLPPFSG
jgi:hypothetical protein